MIPTKPHRIRIIVVASLLVAGMSVLGLRIYLLQVVRHEELTQAVARMHDRKIKLPARRGMILDCNENILAHSVCVSTVVIDPQAIRDEQAKRVKMKQPVQTSDLV